MARTIDAPPRRPLRHAAVGGFTLTEGIHAAGSALPWHTHDGATMCFVLDGAFTEYSRGSALVCYPSYVKFTPAGERHWNRFDRGDARGVLVEVTAERAQALRPYADVLDRQVHFQGGRAAALAMRIHQELRTTDAAAPLAIEGLLLELVAWASRRGRPAAGQPPRWLELAREIIHDEPGERLTLASLAQRVGVHPVTLARAFRRWSGRTVGEYIRQLRVEHAAEALRTSPRTLAEIALDAGFADQSHFSNVFRREFGLSPSEYRRLAGPLGSGRPPTIP